MSIGIASGSRRSGSSELTCARPDSAATLPVRLVWSSVVNARRYQVEILDSAGNPLYAATTVDTAGEVPVTVPLAAGAVYRYWVRALLVDGTEARSEVRRFHVANP